MSKGSRRIQQRERAISRLNEIMTRRDHTVVIHYSCESFYDRSDGTSPRITSIAVANLASQQTSSFSIHQIAEREQVPLVQIEDHYDDLESKMLDEFNTYAQSRLEYTWLHWNMRNIHYGFQALAHRHEVLGGQPVDIPEVNRVDLARLMPDMYGGRYIGHPRMQKLVEKNRISDLDFLSGAEEAEAFENREFVKLHYSTLRKVDCLSTIAKRAAEGSLVTESAWREVYGSYGEAFGEWLSRHWVIQVIGAVFALLGFAATLYQIFIWLN